jgi:hypothetical protein
MLSFSNKFKTLSGKGKRVFLIRTPSPYSLESPAGAPLVVGLAPSPRPLVSPKHELPDEPEPEPSNFWWVWVLGLGLGLGSGLGLGLGLGLGSGLGWSYGLGLELGVGFGFGVGVIVGGLGWNSIELVVVLFV